MSELQLNLLENAIDSLDEALKKYQAAQDGDPKAYKFCVLHLSHFFELAFKYYVVQISPLLVYKTPSKKITHDSFTITLDEAVVILENNDHQFCSNFKTDLKWFKQLRNSIEHHAFSMNLSRVNDTIGRLVSAFDSEQQVLGKVFDIERLKLFYDLAGEYQKKLKAVQSYISDLYVAAQGGARHKFWDDSLFHILNCSECGHDKVVIEDEESDTGYKCIFCGSQDVDEDQIPAACNCCGLKCELGDLVYDQYCEGQPLEWRCYLCSGQYYRDKDD